MPPSVKVWELVCSAVARARMERITRAWNMYGRNASISSRAQQPAQYMLLQKI